MLNTLLILQIVIIGIMCVGSYLTYSKLILTYRKLIKNHDMLDQNQQKLKKNHKMLSENHQKLEKNQEMLSENHQKLIENQKKLAERKVSVKYDPFINITDKLFKKKVVAGYQYQLFYDDLPVGEPSQRIIYQSEEVDKEAIEKAFNAGLGFLNNLLMVLGGVPLIGLKDFKDVITDALK